MCARDCVFVRVIAYLCVCFFYFLFQLCHASCDFRNCPITLFTLGSEKNYRGWGKHGKLGPGKNCAGPLTKGTKDCANSRRHDDVTITFYDVNKIRKNRISSITEVINVLTLTFSSFITDDVISTSEFRGTKSFPH